MVNWDLCLFFHFSNWILSFSSKNKASDKCKYLNSHFSTHTLNKFSLYSLKSPPYICYEEVSSLYIRTTFIHFFVVYCIMEFWHYVHVWQTIKFIWIYVPVCVSCNDFFMKISTNKFHTLHLFSLLSAGKLTCAHLLWYRNFIHEYNKLLKILVRLWYQEKYS